MVKVDAQGNLVLHSRGRLRDAETFVYQEVTRAAGNLRQYQIKIQNPKSKIRWVGFHVGEYDASKPLVIDPVLSYSRPRRATMATRLWHRGGFLRQTY